VLQRDAAIALASAADPDAEGMAWLRAGIASDDAEHRRLVWRWISFSEEVAPLFLDEALERLVVGGDAQSTQRLRSLLGTVAKTRREEVLRAVARLTRHEEEEVSRMAEDLLNQLSAKSRRRHRHSCSVAANAATRARPRLPARAELGGAQLRGVRGCLGFAVALPPGSSATASG
jgi:hypothetical protein